MIEPATEKMLTSGVTGALIEQMQWFQTGHGQPMESIDQLGYWLPNSSMVALEAHSAKCTLHGRTPLD